MTILALVVIGLVIGVAFLIVAGLTSRFALANSSRDRNRSGGLTLLAGSCLVVGLGVFGIMLLIGLSYFAMSRVVSEDAVIVQESEVQVQGPRRRNYSGSGTLEAGPNRLSVKVSANSGVVEVPPLPEVASGSSAVAPQSGGESAGASVVDKPPDVAADPKSNSSETDEAASTEVAARTDQETNLELPSLPEWVETPRRSVDGEVLITIHSDPRLTFEEAEANVHEKLETQVYQEWLARHLNAQTWNADLDGLIDENVIRDRYDEIRLFSMGAGKTSPMHIVHWQVAMTPELDRQIERRWKSEMAQGRVGVLAGLVLFLTICTGTTSVFFQLRKYFDGRYGKSLLCGGIAVVAASAAAFLAKFRELM